MRVCLFWNEAAGEGLSLDELRSHISSAGHEVIRHVSRGEDLRDHLDEEIDIVAAAGGDGTIANAARVLVGGSIPLAILPLGTANNIARSAGVSGTIAEIVATWSEVEPKRMDAIVAECDDRRLVLFESVGAGLVARSIDQARAELKKSGDPGGHLAEARELFLDVLASLRPSRCSLTVDGEDRSGDYLLVEMLNTPTMGPALFLSEDADASDGRLSVVTVTEAERDTLIAHLQALRQGSPAPAGFTARPASTVEIVSGDAFHFDGLVSRVEGPVRVSVMPGGLSILR